MKKSIYAILFTLIFVGCAQKENKILAKDASGSRNEITPFFINKIMLQNINKNENVDPQQFLDGKNLDALQSMVKSFLENTPNKIIRYPNEEPQEKKELLSKNIDFKNIVRIDFYESWYFNSDNNMIEKETLGYSLFEYVPAKEAYRQLYFVFKDEAALEKAKKYYFAYI